MAVSGPAAVENRAPAGFTPMFTYSGERLEEAVQLYESLGYDVVLVPAGAANGPGPDLAAKGNCSCCMGPGREMTIYVRKRRSGKKGRGRA